MTLATSLKLWMFMIFTMSLILWYAKRLTEQQTKNCTVVANKNAKKKIHPIFLFFNLLC